MEYLNYFLLFILGLLAGFINVLSAGGSALTLPMLIFMGLDGVTANGTNRIAIFILSISAVLSMRGENVSDFKLSLKLSIWTIPGALLGAIYAQYVDTESFKNILAIAMIGIIIMIILPKKQKKGLIEILSKNNFLMYPSLFIIGLYGGFIQIGVGFITMLVLESFLDLNLIKVNMHKVFIVFIFTLPAMLIFILNNNVDYLLGIILSFGMGIGGWWSAKISIKKGDDIVKYFLILSILITISKLLNLF